jgi:hypothetical protein
LFVFEKDAHSMYLIETPERVPYHLEAIDTENSEYLFWDSSGAGVCASVTRGVIDSLTLCDPAMTLSQAFEAYARDSRSPAVSRTISTCYKVAYQDFLTLWKDAFTDIPILIETKSEYAKLK